MPRTELDLRLSLSVPHPFRDINNLILDLQRYAKEIPRYLFRHIMVEHQNYLLELYLGKPRIGIQKVSAPWRCPRCGSQHGFNRRGWRSKPRRLITSIGVLKFPLRNISCKKCGKTFSPFPEFWGLDPWQRISKELAEKAVYLATQFSYARSSNTLKELLGQPLSPLTIHRLVKKSSNFIDCKDSETKGETLMFDGTRVPAGTNGKAPLLLGIAVDGFCREYGRNRLQKRIVSFDIDKGWRDIYKPLRKYDPKSVIIDGDVAVKNMARKCFPNSSIQQCIWHLFHTSKHFLWMDGVPVSERRPLLRELSDLVWSKNRKGIKSFIDSLKKLKLKNTANFIENGLDDLLTFTTVDVPFKATSPIEREMREINRRSDVGARWTVKGLYNLLNLKLAYEKNKSAWNKYWDKHELELTNNQIKIAVI